ncbi:MAG: DNA-3-methyladenine glycosylase I [Alphaproteobacteria bacterium]|nr:DNA-3-methyladenine glycosylase I [Alphaproteobacteria bacterium]
MIDKKRCDSNFGIKNYWTSEKLVLYHDTRWCKPEHNDNEQFATLCLELLSSGLSWKIIIEKEDKLRNAFCNFNPDVVALYNEEKINELMSNSNIIRNIQKIKAIINNAQVFLRVQEKYGSFNRYIWNFTNNKIIDNHLTNAQDMPNKTELSESISNNMKKQGFQFIGPTIIYSFMQGIGIVNDHCEYCSYR